MATQDIGSNTFYNLMLSTTLGERDKHDTLVSIFNKPASRPEIDALHAQYIAWRDFLRSKQKAVDNGINEAKDREYGMVQGLGAPRPAIASIGVMSQEQEKQLESLKKSNSQLETILSTMTDAEGASKAFRNLVSNDTFGLFLEVQAQNTSLANLEQSNANTREELQKLGSGTVAPLPLPVAAPQATAPQRYVLGKEILILNDNVVAPERASFKKRSPRLQ